MDAPSIAVMIRGWDIRTGTTGEMALDAARQAEALGLDGVVAGDHVTFHGYGNDALLTLTAVAAVTSRIELRTGVYLLPLRHPVPVALQVAQLDQLSTGSVFLQPLHQRISQLGFPTHEQLARVCVGKTDLMARPDGESQSVGVLYEDAVVPWLREVAGQPQSFYASNLRWVETPDGYIWSPHLQRVRNQPNMPVTTA